MEYIIIFLAVVLSLVGLLGAILPVLPGPPIGFLALLLLAFCTGNDVTTTQLVVAGVVALVITVFDYIAPIWFAKKTGGSKSGTWGATVGLVIGLFVGPIGIIAGPFLGAFIGELLADTPKEKAFGIACMTFMAFMLTTGMKLVYGIVLLVMVFREAWDIVFK